MPQFSHTIHFIRQQLQPSYALWYPLLYPELCRLEMNEASLSDQLLNRVEEITKDLDQGQIHRRRLTETPQIQSTKIELRAPKFSQTSLLWREPVTLEFPFVVWQPDPEHTVAFVPAVDIEILATGKPDGNFVGLVKSEIRHALARNEALSSLNELLRIAQHGELSLTPKHLELDLPTAKAIAEERKADEKERATLKQVAVASATASNDSAFQLEQEIELLAQYLLPPGPQSVLIVGPAGCGKTSLVRELAKQRARYELHSVEFWETSGSRIVAGMSGFGQWQERCQALVDELRKTDSVLHLGNLVELLDVGKSEFQSEGIATFLRSFIQKGQLLAIAECTPEQIAVIEKADPQLLDTFVRLQVTKPDRPTTLKILKDEYEKQPAARRWRLRGNTIDDRALETIFSLHHRYATYSAAPARAVRFLRNMIRDSEQSIDTDSVIQSFAAETGLPEFLLSEKAPLNLKKTHSWFSSRVIGQQEPVDLVVNLLAAIKSDMTPTGRPIASLLFIGPTGVGKTEMAKSIAEYMYGDPARMVRFDMSEYADRLSVDRLIGSGGFKNGQLTSKVRQNPFTVLLLDEFEKAHSSFFDLLLQVLGEGRLTDSFGRVTDFSTVIVIMTSNLGAQTFRQKGMGFSGSTESNGDEVGRRSKEHFSREVQKFIRPELYNRIDRIVPFRPLDRETITRVAQREIDKLKKREGVWYRGVELNISQPATDLIVSGGYDARYGARPLQRFIQQSVVVPLSDRVNQYLGEAAIVADVDAVDQRMTINTRIIPRKSSDRTNANLIASVMEYIQNVRKRAQAFTAAPIVMRLKNEFYRLEQQYRRRMKAIKKLTPQQAQKLPWIDETQLRRYEEINGRIDALMQSAIELENEALVEFYMQREVDPDDLNKRAEAFNQRISELLFEVFTFDASGLQKVKMLAFSRSMESIRDLTNAYLKFAESRDVQVNTFAIRRFRKGDSAAIGILRAPKVSEQQDQIPVQNQSLESIANIYHVSNVSKFLDDPGKDAIGVGFVFTGKAAFPMFSNERGVHLMGKKRSREVLVTTTGDEMFSQVVSPEVGTLGPFTFVNPTRRYDESGEWIEDHRVGRIRVADDSVSEGILKCLNYVLEKHLESLIQSWN